MKREFVGTGVIAFAFFVIAVCMICMIWTVVPELVKEFQSQFLERSDMSEPIAKIEELTAQVKAVNDYMESTPNPTIEGSLAAFDGLPTTGTGSNLYDGWQGRLEANEAYIAGRGSIESSSTGLFVNPYPSDHCYGVQINMSHIKALEPRKEHCKEFAEVSYTPIGGGPAITMTYEEFERRMK